MTRAAVYVRQSLDRHGDSLAVQRQLDDCLRLCADRGWAPTAYVENNQSATVGVRPVYQRLLADVRAGKVDAVVAWDLDRLHRQPRELEDFMTLADRHHLALATVTGDCDLSTDNGRLFARIKGAVSMAETERKSARQKAALRQKAVGGAPWWPSRPFGYDADPHPLTGKWTTKGGVRLHPTEAPLLRDAYAAVLAGTTLHGLCAQWNERGILTPKGNRWRGQQLHALLVAARNAGLREHGGEIVGPGDWPAIVDEPVWRGVVAKLSDENRNSGASRSRVHLLSGLARCGVCGHPMSAGAASSNGAVVYTCKECHGVSRRSDKVDEVVTRAVVARLSQADAHDLLVTRHAPDTDALREQRAALTARLTALGQEYGSGKPAAFIDAAVVSIQTQLALIDAQLTDSSKAAVFADVIGSDAGARFGALELDRQRAVVDSLVHIEVKPTRRGAAFDPESVVVRYR